jgi:hypothetical protein
MYKEAPSQTSSTSDVQVSVGTHMGSDIAHLIDSIRELHRQRVDFHNAEKRLTLQIKAICRRFCGGDKDEAGKLYKALGTSDHEHSVRATAYLLPMLTQVEVLHKERLIPEKEMAKLAKKLPAYKWVEELNGFGALGFAQIVAESGDLNNYANPGTLWKRMGMAPFNGKLPSTWRRSGGLTAQDWEAVGYSPKRRSMIFSIGDSLLKKQNEYRELYLERKVYEEQKLPDGTKMIWHRRSQLYMEKRLLRDLWKVWTGL